MAQEYKKRNIEVKVILSQSEYLELSKEVINDVALWPANVPAVIRRNLGFKPEVYGRNRPTISAAQFEWEESGKNGPMPE